MVHSIWLKYAVFSFLFQVEMRYLLYYL
jgi:hypothetical protein